LTVTASQVLRPQNMGGLTPASDNMVFAYGSTMKRRCGRRRYYSVLLAPQRPKRVLWREGQLPL